MVVDFRKDSSLCKYPYKIHDKFGNDIIADVICLDTDTGECECCISATGPAVTGKWLPDATGYECCIARFRAAPPLTLIDCEGVVVAEMDYGVRIRETESAQGNAS